MRVCPRSGKLCHTRRGALRALVSVLNRRRRGLPGPASMGRVYRCPHCGRWHITSRGDRKAAA